MIAPTAEGNNAYSYQYSDPMGEWSIDLSAILDPDPSIAYGLAIVDIGAPSLFGFVFATPIIPVSGTNTVSAALSYTLTDAAGDGVSVLPTGSYMQVSEVRQGIIGPFTNMGVDLDAFGSTGAGTYNFAAGPQPGPIPAPLWDWLQVSVNFGLSGGGDTLSATGSATIEQSAPPIPEPCTMLLVGSGLFGLAGLRRRFRS